MSTNDLHGIITDAKNGSEQAKLRVIEKFTPLIKKYIYKLAYEDAENDLVLFLLELIPKIPNKLTNDGQIVAYIAKAVYLQYIQLSKKSCDIAAKEMSKEDILEFIPDNSNINEENRIIFVLLCLELDERQRKIIYLHYFAGYSIEEIAEYFHISRQAVNKAKNVALRKLREKIEIINDDKFKVKNS